jgi:hypothetical protein
VLLHERLIRVMADPERYPASPAPQP